MPRPSVGQKRTPQSKTAHKYACKKSRRRRKNKKCFWQQNRNPRDLLVILVGLNCLQLFLQQKLFTKYTFENGPKIGKKVRLRGSIPGPPEGSRRLEFNRNSRCILENPNEILGISSWNQDLTYGDLSGSLRLIWVDMKGFWIVQKKLVCCY